MCKSRVQASSIPNIIQIFTCLLFNNKHKNCHISNICRIVAKDVALTTMSSFYKSHNSPEGKLMFYCRIQHLSATSRPRLAILAIVEICVQPGRLPTAIDLQTLCNCRLWLMIFFWALTQLLRRIWNSYQGSENSHQGSRKNKFVSLFTRFSLWSF